MKQLKEIYEKEILKLKNESDRDEFKLIIAQSYLEMIEKVENDMDQLEKRVLSSIEDLEGPFTVYSTIVEKKNINLYEDDFGPIFIEDLDEIDLDEMGVIGIAPLLLSYEELKNLEDYEFEGTAILDGEEIDLILKLEPETKYLEREEYLYKIFNNNRIKWKVLNMPYNRKMYRLKITNIEKPEYFEKLKDIEYDLEGYEDLFMTEYIPVWNISYKNILATLTPRPTADRLNYEHRVELSNKKGVLLDSADAEIICTYRDQNSDLMVVTDKKNVGGWELWSFNDDIELKKYSSLPYPVFSNEKHYSFINNLKQKNDLRIRTKSEIYRLVEAYKDLKNIQLQDITIGDNNYYVDSYIASEYLENEFVLKGNREVLNLHFSIGSYDFYTTDLLSFIISEIQYYFPEYECKGVSQ